MACKPQYKGVRYNSLEELYRANGVNEQQKQQAQIIYSQYLDSLNKPNTNPILQGNQQEQVKKFAELQERLNNKEFLEGAKNAYESTPDLQQFGTQEEYNDYIARVSLGIIKNPSSGDYNYTSKVKDIVYHGTPKISKANAQKLLNLKDFSDESFNKLKNTLFDKFDKSKIGSQSNSGLKKGFYFSTNKKVALWNESNNLYRVIVNSVNPQTIEGDNKKINFSKLKEATEKGDVVYKNTIDALENNTELLGDTIAVQEPEQIHILGSKQDIEGFKNFISGQDNITQERLNQIQDIFNENPKLNSIGTPEQYSQYLDTIFPDSKVKDIVYHGLNANMPSDFKFNLQEFVFDKSLQRKGSMQGMEEGIFFSNDKEFVQNNFTKYGLFGALLNLKNPKIKGEVEYWKDDIEYLTTQEESLGGKSQLDYLAKGIRPIAWNKYKGYEQQVEALKKDGYGIEEVDGYFIRLSKLKPMEEAYFSQLKKAIDNNAFPYHTNMAGKIIQEAIKNKQDGVIFENLLEESSSNVHNQYVVFEPEQIHILGSKQDIEGFKAFVESNNTKTNNSELMSLNDVKIKQGVAYQQYLELINDEEFKARSLVSYKANLDLKTLGSQEQYLQFNAMQELNILESPNSSDSNIQSQINQTLFEEYVNSIQETDQIDPEQAKYLYDQLSGISPSQMLQTVTRFAEQKLNTTSRKVLMEIFNKVGSKNNVMINFLNKTGQKRSDGVLGWYSNGEVNYNINDITLDTYMHEFSHLWLKVLKARNKESYDVISKKTSDFIKSEHPIAKLINQRLSTYQGEFLIEEATAILAGFISLPSVMKYMGSELNLEDLGYDVISEMFGSDIANLYELVGEEFNQVNTLQDMDFSGSSLFSILDAFSQDVLNGNNPFEIYGETLEELKLRGDLDGYMENNTGPQNLVLDIASLKETLKNDISSRKDFDQMSDTELSTMIDKNFNKFSYQKKDGQWVWSMGSIDLNIQVGQSGILSSSKVAIMEFIRNISKNQINSLKEIGQEIKVAQSSRKSSPTNNPAADIILKHYQTRYGNSKFTVETAKHMASVMGLNSGVHDIFTLDEALVKYPSIFGKVDVNLIKDLSVMVVLHNDPRGSNPQVQISLFSLEKRNNYINPSKNRNIFNKFESVQDKDAIKSGVLLRNNSSSINNLMLGFVLGHLSDSISNLKIRTLGTFEMSKNFNPALIEMDVLFNSLGYIKNIPELFEMFQNETMKTIVEKASNHEYKNLQQAADDVLKTFYYNGIYYSASTEEFIKGKSTEYADMSSSERKSFIAARIKYLENYYGTSTKSSLISDPEYLLLSQELKRISDSKYMPSKYDEQGFRSELIKKLALPHNIKSDTVQWAINTIQTNERLVIHYFRQYRDKLHEVLRPVWDRHVSILPKLTDVGSSAFEHMFMRVQKDGVSFKLPYIYFDGHEKFKGLSESQKKAELTRLNLTQEDMALGNFIMDAVEDSLIESQFVDMQNAAMSVDQANKMTKDDAIDALMRKGWRKSSGQVFVISKSANELTASGRLKAGFARFVRQSIDINAIFEDQMLVTELGTLRNTLNSQLSHDKLLQMAGIESSSDGEYRLFDKDKNEAMSTNLETIANYAVMSNIRQMIHSRESESTYKAALAMIDDMQNVSSDSMERKSYDRLKEYIEDYWTSVVMGKRLDEDFTLWAGPSNTKVNLMAGVDMATRAMGFTLIAYKPIIMAKSYMYNIFNASVWAIGNLVGGEKGLPTPKDLLKAHADYVAHYTKCQAWMEHYQISNSSAYETLNSAVQNVSKKYALNSQMGFLGLQLTDEAMRHVTAIAYMMKNGSWDAHQYTVDSDGVGHLVYDETKDLRMYKDGKITDPGKAIRSAIKRDLVEEGLMKESDEKLLYGYDMQEAVMMRVLSDKWVVGSMSAESGANIVHTVLGRQFAKFRRFMFDNIANMGIGGNPSESRMLSNRIAIQDENGEWISLKEKKEISGTVQSFLAAFAFFKEHGVKGFTELDQLSAIHKANLAKSAAWVSLYFLLYALFGKFKDKEDQKKYLFDLHSWLRDTAVFQNVSDVDKTPIPMIGAFTNLIRTMYKDPIKTLYYLPGGGLVKDVTKSVQHYTD